MRRQEFCHSVTVRTTPSKYVFQSSTMRLTVLGRDRIEVYSVSLVPLENKFIPELKRNVSEDFTSYASMYNVLL